MPFRRKQCYCFIKDTLKMGFFILYYSIFIKNGFLLMSIEVDNRRMDLRRRAKLITKDEFKEFGKLARAERKKCYNGEITLEQFQTWLDDFR